MSVKVCFLRISKVLALICAITLEPVFSAHAAESTDWERWATHNPAQTHVPDHKYLTTFLQAYGRSSRGQTTFAYKAMSGQGVKFLEAYTNYLTSIPVSKLNRDEQLTYWLNLYNTGVIHAVASQKRLPKRMDKHRGNPGMPGAMWSSLRFEIEGYTLSLEDIEMNILSRHWSSSPTDIMWVYGLSYAAKGSPSLPLMAFYGSTVHSQLDENARAFIARSANVRLRKNRLELSQLYEWHRAHLGNTDADIIEHVKRLSGDKMNSKLDQETQISDYSFSWRTNNFVPSQTSSGPISGAPDTGGMQGY